ncbi:MAG: hypothetical protein GX256_03695 [Fretibacterium sp.]|nr:hypothetical protein [Fretibacterium sp.]
MLSMHYLKFAGWLAFITWIVSDTTCRYLIPLLSPVYDALEELRSGAWNTGKAGPLLSLIIQIGLSLALAWLLTTWSSWCVLFCMTHTQSMETGRFLYSFTGFLFCEYALAKMAKVDRYRSFFMSIFHFTMAMGAFVVYSMNPTSIRSLYPWLARWMGVSL